MRNLLHIFSCLLLATSLGRGADGQPLLELRQGDRVVFVGDTWLEREQESGHIESGFYSRFSDRQFIVRNLSWSGDTPAGISRASFDFAVAGKGFERLKEQLQVI